MKVIHIIKFLREYAPEALQENYDNSGLQTGNPGQDVTGIIVCLDVTGEVVEEAVRSDCNLIVAHHPLLFHPLRSLTGSNKEERILIKAVKHDLAIYAAHTNLDNTGGGVNARLCNVLGIKNPEPISGLKGSLKKLVTFVPEDKDEKGRFYPDLVRDAIGKAGAGKIGNYDTCTFNTRGTGTFRAGPGSNPYSGEINKLHREEEVKIEAVFPAYQQEQVITSLINAHPYEEVAYDVIPLDNTHPEHGTGMIGYLRKPVSGEEFLKLLKRRINQNCLKHSSVLNGKISRVAVCGGSGSHLLETAIIKGADAFVTSDVKYHSFMDAENRILLVDAGHYETEACTIDLLYEILLNKFTNFAVSKTKINTNPINYF